MSVEPVASSIISTNITSERGVVDDSDEARKLRDPTNLPLLFRDCNGEYRVAWAKADTGAAENIISAGLLAKLRRPPSNDAVTPQPLPHEEDVLPTLPDGEKGEDLAETGARKRRNSDSDSEPAEAKRVKLSDGDSHPEKLEAERTKVDAESVSDNTALETPPYVAPYVVQGGLGLTLPTKPTKAVVKTFDDHKFSITEVVTLNFDAGNRHLTADFWVWDTSSPPSSAGSEDEEQQANDSSETNHMPDLLLGRPWLLANHVLAFDPSFLETPVAYPHVLEPPDDDSVREKLCFSIGRGGKSFLPGGPKIKSGALGAPR